MCFCRGTGSVPVIETHRHEARGNARRERHAAQSKPEPDGCDRVPRVVNTPVRAREYPLQQPNILMFQVDQLTALALRTYGDPVCHAPTIDSLADSGVVFENAYCNFPLCAPSRFSMASGQLCSAIGAFDNAAEFPAGIPTYAHYLRALGYHTCLAGKMHFIGPDQHHGFEQRLTADLYPADFSWVPNWGNEGKRDTNDTRSVTIAGVCERSVQIEFDEEVTLQAERYLSQAGSSGSGRPFFLQVSYTHPHEPYLCQRRYWDLYEPDGVPPPSTTALDIESHDAHSVRLLKDFGMLDHRFSEKEIQRARRGYYGSISYIDGLVARVLAVLRSAGLDSSTIVLFTSDHGDMLGERGLWFKKHFYEPAMRVPLLVQAPWIRPNRVAAPVSLVDLLPTLNALAGGDPLSSDATVGMDLCTLFASSGEEETRTVFAEYLAEAAIEPLFMIRRGRHKFVHAPSDGHLLFDLHDDPLELDNLADRSDHAALVNAFDAEARAKWDRDRLDREIRISQQRRIMVRSAHGVGAPVRWNHDESPGEKVPWYRGEQGYSEWAFNHLPARQPTDSIEA